MKYLKTYKLFEGIETELDVHNQNPKLKVLPDLSDELEIIDCHGNELKFLPKLPPNLKYLACSWNELEMLPELPYSLSTLYCSKNKLKILPKLPKNLDNFYCWNNPLECLIPDKFVSLQDKKWLENYYYPMINSYEGQKKMLDRDITKLKELERIVGKLHPRIKKEYKDIIKQTDWS